MEKAIQWFNDRRGKVTYSMAYRNGPGSYDCSSAVYYALIQQGIFPANIRIGNTDSLFSDLERHGFQPVQPNSAGGYNLQRGDVFIWGRRGASGGAAGHTGLFINSTDIIHCAYGYNGIHVDNHNTLWGINGYPAFTAYRYVGGYTPQPTPNAVDQIVEIGSYIKFDREYRVDDLQFIGGIWQVRTNELCKEAFTWADNGIPAEPLVEVEDTYATEDQVLAIGSKYKLPGKWYVHDIGYAHGMWLAQIGWNGLKFWVDIETATEVSSTDGGTPAPGQRPPQPPQPTPTPPSQPELPPTVTPVPEPPVEREPNPDEPPVVLPPEPEQPEESPKEDEDMARTEEKQREELRIATERVAELAADVHDAPSVKVIVDSIPKPVKIGVYIIGDALIGAGLLTPSFVQAFAIDMNLSQVAAMSALLGTAGGFLLTMFGIYKSSKQ